MVHHGPNSISVNVSLALCIMYVPCDNKSPLRLIDSFTKGVVGEQHSGLNVPQWTPQSICDGLGMIGQ